MGSIYFNHVNTIIDVISYTHPYCIYNLQGNWIISIHAWFSYAIQVHGHGSLYVVIQFLASDMHSDWILNLPLYYKGWSLRYYSSTCIEINYNTFISGVN